MRTLTTPGAAQLPESLRASPRLPIRSVGPVTAPDGHIRDLGRSLNLGYSTGYAGVAYQGGWADGQLRANGGVWRTRISAMIPRISKAHNSLRIVIFGKSTGGNGQMRARAGGGAWSPVVPIGGGAPKYHPVGSGALFGIGAWTIDPDGDYAIIEVQLRRGARIVSVMVSWVDIDPTGSYPGPGGLLPAGVVGGFSAIDDDETAAGRPVSARLLAKMAGDITHIEERVRPLIHMCGINGTAGASTHRWLESYIHRRTVMVLADRRRLVLWMWTRNTSGQPLKIVVYIGRTAALSEVPLGTPVRGRYEVIVPPNSGVQWSKGVYDLASGRLDHIPDSPSVYESITEIAVQPMEARPNRCLMAVTGWDRRS